MLSTSKLKVIAVETNHTFQEKPLSSKPETYKQRQKAKESLFERAWLLEPHQFDTTNCYRENQRIKRSLNIIHKWLDITNTTEILEVGCGYADISRQLADQGAKVLATDISSNALKLIPLSDSSSFSISQEGLPETKLNGNTYDLVIAADVLADLDMRDVRLSLNEISRLMRPEGKAFISTSLDLASTNALEVFASLLQTEFEILDWRLSYYRLAIQLDRFLNFPLSCLKANIQSPNLDTSKTIPRVGIFLAQTKGTRWLIKGIAFIANFLNNSLKSPRLQDKLELFCKFWWQEAGANHVMIIAKKKQFFS